MVLIKTTVAAVHEQSTSTSSFVILHSRRVDVVPPHFHSAAQKVREHPTKGPFVEGALTAAVTSAREAERLLVDGQARRAVAGTNMNEASSRSHAIFTLVVTKVELDLETGAEGFTTSKVQWSANSSACNETIDACSHRRELIGNIPSARIITSFLAC